MLLNFSKTEILADALYLLIIYSSTEFLQKCIFVVNIYEFKKYSALKTFLISKKVFITLSIHPIKFILNKGFWIAIIYLCRIKMI